MARQLSLAQEVKVVKKQKLSLVILALLLIATLVIPPLFDGVFNRIEPWVCGMPFLIFWLVAVNIMVAVILFILWLMDRNQEA